MDLFYEALAELLKSKGLSVSVVTGYDEVNMEDGYCETCWYEWTEANIYYLDEDSTFQIYNYRGSFVELIRDLTN